MIADQVEPSCAVLILPWSPMQWGALRAVAGLLSFANHLLGHRQPISPPILTTKWRRKSGGQNCLCCSLCGATLADGSSGRIPFPKDFVISWIPHRYCSTSSYVSLSLPSIRDIIRISLTSLQATATRVVLLPPSLGGHWPCAPDARMKNPPLLVLIDISPCCVTLCAYYVNLSSSCFNELRSFLPSPSNEGLCWN